MNKMLIVAPLLLTYFHATELTSICTACEKKIAPACYQLALLYDKGQGLNQDPKKAKEYYLEACNYGYEKGCINFEQIKTEK